LTGRNQFRASTSGKVDRIEGWFSNAGALTKFDLITTAEQKDQRDACLADLNENHTGV